MNIEFIGTGRSRSQYIGRCVLAAGAVLTLVASALSISAGGVSAATRSKSCVSANGLKSTSTAICDGLAFYKGKTVTFIAPTSAGSGYDVESRAFTREMSSYLGASINVEDISTGATVSGQDALAASTPDGLTIGFYNLATDYYDTITSSPGVDFNVKDVSILGGTPNNTDILVTQSTSPYTSFATLKTDDSASAPAKILFSPGAPATEVILFMKEFGMPATYVSGYSGTAAVTTGFIRGDGPLDGSSIASVEPYIEAGTVRVLAVETQTQKPNPSIPLYSTLQKDPTAGALLKKYPPKTNGEKAAEKYAAIVDTVPNFVVGAPSAVPSYLIATLDAAVKYAAKSTYVKTQILAVGNPDGYTSPKIDKANLVTDLASAPKVKSYLGY